MIRTLLAKRLPFSSYVLMIAQGVGISCSVLSVSISALTTQFITGSTSLATLASGAQFFALFASVYTISRLMEHYGRRIIFFISGLLGVMVTPTALMAIELKSLALIILAHCFLGIFSASVHLYRFAILDITPKDRHAEATSLIMLGGVIASILGPTLLRHSERFTDSLFIGGYISIGLLSCVLTLMIATVRFPPPRPKKIVNSASVSSLLKQPIFIFSALTGGTVYGLMNAIMNTSTLEMHAHGFAIPSISIVIQWHVFAMFAPSLFSGWLIKRLGIGLFLITGIAFMTLSAIWGLLQPTYFHFFISLFLLGIGWNFLYIGSTYLIGQYFQGDEKFKAQGLNDTIVHLLSTSFSLSAGLMLSVISWAGMQILSIIVMLAILTFLVFLYKGYFRKNLQKA